ncbi:MAG: hypothetical protein GC171_05470 [Terrimonas sp.]|nr:hypothetical protein [Terrimonas sp.]
MLSNRKVILFLFLMGSLFHLQAQKIIYSEPEKDDNRRVDFEIIGKIGGNFLVYKNIRNDNFICVYDNDMKLVEKVRHDYMPEDRLINVDFFPYADFSYMIYQYQRRNVIHCMAVKIDGLGKKMNDPVELDTTHIGVGTNNKIYTALSSEDRSKIIIFKINSKNKRRFFVTTLLYDNNLTALKKSELVMPMDERNDYLGEFLLDNDGNLVFTKFYRNSNDNITAAYLVSKETYTDSFTYVPIDFQDIYLDELRIKIDNFSKRYFVNSFYYQQKRGNIEGMYFFVWDQQSGKALLHQSVVFGDGLRKEAKDNGNLRSAFNDFFIRNIITKADGGFIVSAESYYSTSRSGSWNRWDYMYGSPFSTPIDYYYYSPYYSSWYWRSRYNNNSNVRYHAENIIILSFDKEGRLEWNNVIKKEQFDDDSDDRISYQVMNTGGELHFLFNIAERRSMLLTDFSLKPGGDISRNPTLKNLDKGYDFLTKYAKQVSARQMIIPCLYRSNYICFAKLEYN